MQRLQLTLVIVLLTQILQVLPAEALTYDEIVLLTQAERKVFGAIDNTHSFDERIKALESNTGSHAAGSESKRIRAVCARLGLIAPEPAAVPANNAAKEKSAKAEAAKLEAARIAEQKKLEQKKAAKEARSDEQNKLKERRLAELAAAKKEEQEKLRELKQLQAEEKRRKAEAAKEAQTVARQEANKLKTSASKPRLASQINPDASKKIAAAAGSATSSAPALLPDSMQQKSAPANNSSSSATVQNSPQEKIPASSNSGSETQGAQSGIGVMIAAVVVVLVLGCLGTVIFLFLKAAGNTEKQIAFDDDGTEMDEQFPHRHPIVSSKKKQNPGSDDFAESEKTNFSQPTAKQYAALSDTTSGVTPAGQNESNVNGAPVFMPSADVTMPRSALGIGFTNANSAPGFASAAEQAPVPVHLPQPDFVDAPAYLSPPDSPMPALRGALPEQTGNPVSSLQQQHAMMQHEHSAQAPAQNPTPTQRRGSETFSVIESLLSREKQAMEAKKHQDNSAHAPVFVPNSTPDAILDAWGPAEPEQKDEALPPFPGQLEASLPALEPTVGSAEPADVTSEPAPQGKEKRPFPFGAPKPASSSSVTSTAKPSPLEETITLSAAEISASLAGIGEAPDFLEEHQQGYGSTESDEQLAAFADAILSTAESSSAPSSVSSPSVNANPLPPPAAPQAPPVPPVRPVPPMPPTPPGASALAHPPEAPHHKPTNKDLRSLFSGSDTEVPAVSSYSANAETVAPLQPVVAAPEHSAISNTAAQSNYAANPTLQPQFKTVHDFMYEQKKPIQYKKCPRCAFSYSIDARNCINDGEVLELVELDPSVIFSFGDRYEVEAVIASGGMSILYQARHKMLNRSVAIKVMDPQMAKNHSAVKRFQQEAQLICQMSHPNVVRVHDFGSNSSGQPFIVMDYLTGRTITQILDEEGQLSWDRARNIFLQVASGLSHAHKLGVIHRDIKPTNVVVTQDEFGGEQATIVDFGIAKMSTPDSREKFTIHGETVGTPMYMSPEQCRGSEVDYRTDVYSLGTLMFETLTGKTPYIASSAFEMRQMIVTAPAPKLADIRPDLIVPPICESIVKRCLQKDPSLRFQNLDELISELAHG